MFLQRVGSNTFTFTGMKKIAVCLSGQIRHWEETYPIFEHWNNLFDDVEFTFFVSTWDSESWVDSKFGGCIEYEDIDFTKYDFIKAHSKHDSNNAKLANIHKKPCTPYLSFLLNKVQTLRKNYEIENNFEFDGVIQTRNDIFVSIQQLNNIRKETITKNDIFKDKVIFTTTSLADSDDKLILPNDNFYYGTSKVMDVFAGMYDYLLNDAFSLHTHYLQAEFFVQKGIGCYKMRGGVFLVRGGVLTKRHRPSPEKLRKLLEEKGAKYLVETKWEELQREFE